MRRGEQALLFEEMSPSELAAKDAQHDQGQEGDKFKFKANKASVAK